MDENSKYYHIHDSTDQLILSDRLEINWVEIGLYPTAIFMVLFVGTGLIMLAILVAIMVGVLYIAFRYLAWFLYSEFSISKSDGAVRLTKKFMDHVRSVEVIDKSFQFNKVYFQKHERGGKTKYLLTYRTFKQYDIMVIRSVEHKEIIEEELMKLSIA